MGKSQSQSQICDEEMTDRGRGRGILEMSSERKKERKKEKT